MKFSEEFCGDIESHKKTRFPYVYEVTTTDHHTYFVYSDETGQWNGRFETPEDAKVELDKYIEWLG